MEPGTEGLGLELAPGLCTPSIEAKHSPPPPFHHPPSISANVKSIVSNLISTCYVINVEAKTLVAPARLCDNFGGDKGVGNLASKLKPSSLYSLDTSSHLLILSSTSKYAHLHPFFASSDSVLHLKIHADFMSC